MCFKVSFLMDGFAFLLQHLIYSMLYKFPDLPFRCAILYYCFNVIFSRKVTANASLLKFTFGKISPQCVGYAVNHILKHGSKSSNPNHVESIITIIKHQN